MSHPMHRWLTELGTKKRGERYILDGFDHSFYLVFDAAKDEDNPESYRTVDVLAVPVARDEMSIRLLADAGEYDVARLLFALGPTRFSEKTRAAMYQRARPIRLAAKAGEVKS